MFNRCVIYNKSRKLQIANIQDFYSKKMLVKAILELKNYGILNKAKFHEAIVDKIIF